MTGKVASIIDGNGLRDELAGIPPERRMLLLPHCLRPTEGCPGVMTRQGLDCGECRRAECKIGALRDAAVRAGYGSICIAPGGRLAVRCVADARPAAILAVACEKELADGVAAVNGLEWLEGVPLIVQIPLLRDGCVDTDVDLDQALEWIRR